ncbi:hypothetical protein ABZP36_001370 [Zizania latifolia]
MSLLHPFTGDIVDLPPILSLLPRIQYLTQQTWPELPTAETCSRYLSSNSVRFCAATAISASPAGAVTVMICFFLLDTSILHVAHATAGDEGKLYAAAAAADADADMDSISIYQIDPPQSNADGSPSPPPPPPPPPRKIAESPPLQLVGRCGSAHLVECGSEMMLVGFSDTSAAHLLAYRLADLTSGRAAPATTIGGHALLLGERALCVSPSRWLPSGSANSIIRKNGVALRPASRFRLGRRSSDSRFQQHHLGSGTCSTAIHGVILGSDETPASPPYTLKHIFTCCYPNLWNDGVLIGLI